MTAKLNFFPLGNADTLRIDLADGRKMLIDYAAMKIDDDDDDNRCDLPEKLCQDLRDVGRNYYDVVCITHADTDHCKGFCEFFWLNHAAEYQDENRIKIEQLWVPAAVILEKDLEDDARLVQSEARHRLKEGEGILVFSRPEGLKKWMEDENIDFNERKHLIVDAGQTVPGFKKTGPECVEFFVHCPFGSRQSDGDIIDRNNDSIVLHATFVEGTSETRLLLASDVDYETLSEIVGITRSHNNEDRLRWDIMKLPHHCSYKSLGLDRGNDETEPEENVKWLFEDRQEEKALIVSTSNPVPEKNSEEDKSDHPPHRQAANYYRRITDEKNGGFKVTMESPTTTKPEPFTCNITVQGFAINVAAPMIISSAAASTPKAG